MKKLKVSALALALAGTLTLGAAAAGVQSITANSRPDITVVVNDVEQEKMTDVNGKQVYPLSYNGTVYLPIRALGDVLSHDADWDGDTQTITLTARDRLPAFTDAEGAQKAIDALEREINALKSAADYPDRAKQYADYSAKLGDISDDLELLYTQTADDFDMGRISYDAYRTRITRLDTIDDQCKSALEVLEKKTIADTSGYQSAYDYSKARLDELDAALKSVEKKIAALVSGKTYTERVKQYNALDKELAPLQAQERALMEGVNDDLRENRLTYAQYNTLATQADGLDNRMKSTRESLEKKTISIDGDKPEPVPGSGNYDTYAAKVADLEARVKSAAKNSNNNHDWPQLRQTLEALDREIDQLDDELEDAYRDGKLTSAEYRALEKSLDKAEDRLDHAEDRIEDLWDRDDDDDDDWDD